MSDRCLTHDKQQQQQSTTSCLTAQWKFAFSFYLKPKHDTEIIVQVRKRITVALRYLIHAVSDEVLTWERRSKRAKSSLRMCTNSEAGYVEEMAVKPTISAKRMLSIRQKFHQKHKARVMSSRQHAKMGNEELKRWKFKGGRTWSTGKNV